MQKEDNEKEDLMDEGNVLKYLTAKIINCFKNRY